MKTRSTSRVLHRVGRGFLACCFGLALCAAVVASTRDVAADPPNKTRISEDINNESHDGRGYKPVVSADGSIIAFTSSARLTASAPANVSYITYVYDAHTGHIIWNSERAASDTTDAGYAGTFVNDITADGKVILLYSGSDLAGDSGGAGLFTHNLETGATVRVSLDTNGDPVTRLEDIQAYNGSLTSDGQYVAFASLVFDENGGHIQLLLRDLTNGTTQEINPTGYPVGGKPVLSDDARYVAYIRQSVNLPAVYDRVTDTTIVPPTTLAQDDSNSPVQIAPDGSSVLFSAVPAGYSKSHVYRMEVPSGTVTDLTTTSNTDLSSQSKGGFSTDGNTLTFASQVALTGDTSDGEWAVYKYDIATDTYVFVDKGSTTTWPYSAGGESDVSDDGDVVAYVSAYEEQTFYANVYIRSFNGWSPPTATWAPQPWDDTAPDLNPPVLTPNFDPDTWYQGPKLATFTCVDPEEGTLTPPPAQEFTTEGYSQVTASCSDPQGNTTTHYWQILVDSSVPNISDTWLEAESPAGTEFHSSSVVTDGWSGVDEASCDIAEGTVLSVGTHTVTCTATDAVGNSTSGSATITIESWHQATMGVTEIGSRKRNLDNNNKSVITINEERQAPWGDMVVVSANIGSGEGIVKCKDSKGNDYTKVFDKMTSTGRLVMCATPVTTALRTGDTVTMTYPAYNGISVATATTIRGLDTPGVLFDKSSRVGTGTDLSTGKATPSGTRFVVFSAFAYTGNATYTLPDAWSMAGAPLSAGSGAAKRTIVPVWNIVRGNPDDWYRLDTVFSKDTPWQAGIGIWLGQNSGPDPA